jgi:hypothetical protein
VTPKSAGPSAAPSAATGLAPPLLRAVGAAVLGAGVWIGLAGPFAVTWGLLAVALFVGWLVGSSARSGATASGATASGATASGATASGATASGASAAGSRIRAVAVGGALFAWVLALAGVYLYSLATLPSLGPAGTSLAERIAATPILSFYAQQFGPVDALEGVLLVVAAWWSAR